MSTNFCMILLVLYYWVRSSRLLIFYEFLHLLLLLLLIILMILTPSLANDVGTFLINCKSTFIDGQRSLPRNPPYFVKSSSQYFRTSFRVFGTERQLQETGYKYIFDAQKTAQSLEFDILYLMRSYSSVKTIWGLSHIILEGI